MVGARSIFVLAALAALLIAAPARGAEWLAGDGHVHTCYSHDAYCGPGDDEGEDAFYSFGGTVTQRFAEASVKGLDFLVISDHNNVRAHTDPGFGTQGVTGIHAYEASLDKGHAQMIGARKVYALGDGSDQATIALANALRGDGGVFQANHPADGLTGGPITTCAEAVGDRMSWRYGYSVLPSSVEVWNATTMIRPSEYFWECWLQRGARVPALAGSDSHGANHLNIGIPTTWAFAASNSHADVMAALRAGRTTLSRVPPSLGAVRLILEGDANRDGKYEAMIGDTVPPGTPLQVRMEGAERVGTLSVRANGRPVGDDSVLAPGATRRVTAPAEPGWVRATLYLDNGGVSSVDPNCAPPAGPPPVSTCSEDWGIAAMTSPIWVGEKQAPGEPPPPTPPPRVDPPPSGPPPSQPPPDSHEPDRPAPPANEGSQPLGEVPPQGERPPPVSKLRATWFRAAAARHRSLRVRLRWKASEGPFDVQARRAGSKKWRTIATRTQRRQAIVRLKRGKWVLRARAVPAFSPAGPWRSISIRL